jgi:thiosulfate/3-mercaptopyruvate sulfurtransferase
VAFTLIYAGVKNVAVLDGGYPKWVVEGRGTNKDAPEPLQATYEGKVSQDIFVSIEYLNKNLQKADILDARDGDVYFGVTIEPFAAKAGHIPTARSLPAPWIWEARTGERNGTHDIYYLYREPRALGRMASGVLREAAGGKEGKGLENKEIIVYCGVGGYASSWWFVLTQVLGYQNVKLYDGAAQEWVRHHDMVPYQWD